MEHVVRDQQSVMVVGRWDISRETALSCEEDLIRV